ncbi:hypothetical protein N9949_02160 [Akkermansiaceae bacterium]|nr:hypothetical protein [Akkermansiaceae bacterium]
MGKRSNYERVERDYYPTPISAVEPLIPHLPYTFDYVEPCAGDGRLIKHIYNLTQGHGDCLFASDIAPQSQDVRQIDALELDFGNYGVMDYCITNPPWDRKFLHPFIEHWVNICPTWLLFDADWMHTKQSAMYMTYCSKVVSVGRVKWIEGSKNTGKDNCAWYLFDAKWTKPTEFYGRLMA